MQKARPCFSARIWFGRILRQQRVQGRGRTFLNRFSAYMLLRARYKGTPRGAKRFKFVFAAFPFAHRFPVAVCRSNWYAVAAEYRRKPLCAK